MRWVGLLVVAGCVEHGSTPAVPHEACTALEGASWQSVTQGECGLGPNGPVFCTWELTFSTDTLDTSRFDWAHSDVGQSGTVHCRDNAIISADAAAMTMGTFDLAANTVTWVDVTYTR